jgi:hypothetical protein
MTRKLLKDFERLAAQRENEDVRHYINKLAIEYQKNNGFNPRRFMMELSEALKNGEHLV